MWNERRACVCWSFGLLAILWIEGCGGSPALPGPQPYPVQGQVTYQGKPAAGFRVSLFPLFEQSGPKFAPSALTDASGNFELQSYQPGDGAPPGDYAVTFTWPQDVPGPDPDDAPQQTDRLRGRFSDPERSQFKVTVHEGENVLEPFVLP
jgi:hypothetical protein